MIRIFLSYVSADESFAERLATDLGAYAQSIFYAKWNIKVGDSIIDKINQGLSSHSTLVVILSTASVRSEWVKKELNSSLMRQLKDRAIKILPVLLDDCDIPPLIADIKYADFREDYNRGFTSLLSAFDEDFDLEPYLGLVEAHLSPEEPRYDAKTLAILLRRLMPIQFGCLEILSQIQSQGEITESEGNIEARLAKVIREKLVEKTSKESKSTFKFTALGKIVFGFILAGLNEGIISPTCSS